jgi:hypothetical protein
MRTRVKSLWMKYLLKKNTFNAGGFKLKVGVLVPEHPYNFED